MNLLLRRRPRLAAVAVALASATSVALPGVAGAVGAPQRQAGRPSFDARARALSRPASTPAARRLARALGPQGIVQLSPITGTPQQVARTDGFLTGRSGASPAAIALGYVRAHADVFRLGSATIAALGAPQDVVSPGGTHHLTWIQRVNGIPVLGAELRAHVTADGRLLAVQGAPLATPPVLSTTPSLSAAQALAVARGNVGASRTAPRALGAGRGAQRRTAFAGGSSAQLVVFAGPRGNRLAWQVRARVGSIEDYLVVLDAGTGAVLQRHNLVRFASGSGTAWQYAPTPILAGGTTQALRSFPNGWITSAGTALSGDFAHVYSDVNDNDQADAGEDVVASGFDGSLLPVWNYPFNARTSGVGNCSATFPCSWQDDSPNSWQANRAQNATQAFWFVNTFHDHLAAAPIGFADFHGSDAVQAETDDGANLSGGLPEAQFHTDNANMSTPPAGSPPIMQMYLFEPFTGAPFVDGNGGDDASVIYHEYTHGLSSRLIVDSTGAEALNGRESGAMGEAWSDWYAMDFLVDQGLQADDPGTDGQVRMGAYVSQDQDLLRSEPLDCPVGTSDPACPFGGYTFADFGHVFGGGPEVHADGEIWGQTLWDLRTALGSSSVSEQIVTDAMRLSPTEPSFLDMRDAILLADQADFGGAHADALWQVFATRGMGYYAGAESGDDPAPFADDALPPAAGDGTGTLSGTVTDAATGAPISGATVSLPGYQSHEAFTGADGGYALTGVPVATYPRLVVSAPGYDDAVVSGVEVRGGGGTQNVLVRRDWALSSGGTSVAAFNGPDFSNFGCGPDGAVDGLRSVGWSSYQPSFTGDPANGLPSAASGLKQLTLALPAAIDVQSFEIDPGANCGDDDGASLKSYRIETSPDGATWTIARSGSFSAANNHRRNVVTPFAGTTGVRYVRLTMLSQQDGPGTSSGGAFMDVSELAVFDAATPAQPAEQFPPPPPPPPPPPAVAPVTPPAAPAVDLTAPTFTRFQLLAPRRHGLRALRSRRGLPLRVRCDERCSVHVSASISGKVARALGLTRRRVRTFTLSRPRVIVLSADETGTLRLKLSRAVARRLGRARSLRLTVQGVATDAAGNVSKARRLVVTLRR